MKKTLPKAQRGAVVKKVAKVITNSPTPVTKPKVKIPDIDPRSGKPLTLSQIEAIKSGRKLDFHTVDEQNAKRDLKKAVDSRTNPKPPAKKSTVKSRQAEYEKALWESYQQKGGVVKKETETLNKIKSLTNKNISDFKNKFGKVKKKFQDGGSTKSFKNPLTGRTRVTEGWKEKTKKTGTVPPRPGYAEKTVDVYNKKGDKIKTVNKTRQLVQQAKGDGFIRRGRDLWDYDKKVTKYKKG